MQLQQLDQAKTVSSLDMQDLKISGKSVTTGSGNKANIAMPDVKACQVNDGQEIADVACNDSVIPILLTRRLPTH